MRCNIPSMNSTLRSVRPLNDLYGSNKLNKPSTDPYNAGVLDNPQEFQQHDEFDPIEKCVTIASACNRFWRKKLLTANSIATEPMQGWQGARSNQSLKAFKWLPWQEHLFCRHSPFNDKPQEDCNQHANNGGEQRLLNFLVDGLDVRDGQTSLSEGCPLWGKNQCCSSQSSMSM